jgi:hypothetical protein
MELPLCLCGFLLSTALTANGGERLTMTVSPEQSFAPKNLTVRVHVAPDTANRTLGVSAESSEHYRSSLIQLDGDEASQTVVLEFRGLQGGAYEGRGTLIDSVGHEHGSVRKQVNVVP